MQEAEKRTQDAQEALQRLEESEATNRELQQQVATTEGQSEELLDGLKASHPTIHACSQTWEALHCSPSDFKHLAHLTASQTDPMQTSALYSV